MSRQESSSIDVDPPKGRAKLLRDSDNWPLFYHTLKNMTTRQLVGVLERTARQQTLPRLPVDYDAKYEDGIPETLEARPEPIRAATDRLRECLQPAEKATYRESLEAVQAGDVTFLNTPIPLGGPEGPEWAHTALDEQSAIWRIKFYGFEFLAWLVFSAENPSDHPEGHSLFREWVRDWARSDETRIGTPRYLRGVWTPHAVSLRILNLSRYYSWCAESETDPEFLSLVRRLVYKNASFLENHVEHDVGGNHLIENGAALVTAGVLFPDAGREWLDTGLSVLESAESQFLGDGGHFERSPMYHLVTLTRYLTVLDVLRESGLRCPPALEEIAERATAFTRSIRPPDNRIPLLNDSVFGEAHHLETCLAYARAVGVDPEPRNELALPDSGYFWLGEGDDRLLVDGGEYGPPHLPGHSHNDLFSLLLWVDGRRLLTDTGTYHYEATARRQHSRSVKGHNTVQVGSKEPVPIGGQYLAGRRIEPTVRYVKSGDLTMFDGEYQRCTLPDQKYTHRRRIFAADDWWLVQDRVVGAADEPLRQRLHLHPQVDVADHPGATSGVALRVSDETLAYVLSPDSATISETISPYYPEFGLERERSALLVETTPGTNQMTLLLSKPPYSTEEVQRLKSSLADVDHRAIEQPLDLGPPRS